MKHRILLLFALFSFAFANAQNNITVSGKVLDADTKEELIGVSIIIDGSKGQGTATDFEGNYKLESVSPNATLNISYVGYAPQQVKVNGATELNILLKNADNELDEFVVVGYTSQKKRDVLGSLGKVGQKELVKVPLSSAAQALQGRISGVQVSSATGAPGAGVSVRVRGVSSIQLSNEPLYIIDGVQVEGGLNAISPNDIEDIVVLKDASTTAIYGSRASNGIVLITTKGGKKGESKIRYNGQFGVQQHGKLMKMTNTADYVTIYNEATVADNIIAQQLGLNGRPLIEGSYLNNLANQSHLDAIFQTATLQTHELSVSGGNDKTTYLISGTYFDQEGIVKGSDHNKATLRANIKTEAKPWLTTGLNVIATTSKTRSVPSSGDGYKNSEGGSVVRYAMFRNPAIPIYNSSGGFVDKPSEYFGADIYDTFFGEGHNPVGIVNNLDRKRTEKNLLASGNISIKLPYNIVSKTVVGIDYNNGEYRSFSQNWGTANRISNPNSLAVENYSKTSWTANSILTYNNTFAEKHNLSVLGGVEAVHTSEKAMNATDSNFADDIVIIGVGKDIAKRHQMESEKAFALASYFGSVNYNFENKYYVAATLRRDGTSRFAENNKWGTFYSVSGGWNIESEEFMKNVKFIETFKLRGGYGTVGNQFTGSYYPYSNIISPNYNYPLGGTLPSQGYTQTQLGNKDLKWETNKQLNVGIDMSFMKGSLGFSVDYYRRKSEDMLMKAALPLSAGYVGAPDVNNGSMLNTGIDLEVFYRKDYKDAGFNISVNGGYLRNEVLSINPFNAGRVDAGLFATRTSAGQPVGSFYMYEMEGIFQNRAEILTSAYQGGEIQPGDVKYVDQNNDGVIDDKDRKYLGSAIPKFTTGINLSGYWRNFDASCFFQGAFGHKNYIQVFQDIEGFYRGFNVTQRYFDERWQGEGTSNTQPRASWRAKSNNTKVSSRFLEDASYMRLKNVQIGYTLPNVKRLGLESLRIYIAGTNLLTFTKYPGLDPEMTVSANSSGEGDTAAGIDWGTYPVAKSYTIGVNLTF